MNPLVGGIIVAFLGSAIWPALLPKVIEWRNRRRDREIRARDTEREASDRRREAERDTWFRESRAAYNRVKRECASCTKELRASHERWWALIDGLEDMCSSSDTGYITVLDVRTLVRKTRKLEQEQSERTEDYYTDETG